jgi:hypothetical protein
VSDSGGSRTVRAITLLLVALLLPVLLAVFVDTRLRRP